MLKIRIAVIFLFVSLVAYSQGETNIWYFGVNAGLDFNSGEPVALIDGQMDAYEGCATISNATGQLLFYTDGITIYNRNHQIMQNGTGLFGNGSSTQSATIIQKPGSTSLYYVFTVDAHESSTFGLRYSIVDISLNSGLGAVTNEKNVLVIAGATEKFAVVKKANNIDFWIVTILKESNNFQAFTLSSFGVSNVPIVSYTTFTTSYYNTGYLKFSPKGNKLVLCDDSNNYYARLFDFNNATGVISNPVLLTNPNPGLHIYPYGAEFSPNGEVLYISGYGKIEQYNLNAANIQASLFTFTLPELHVPMALQIASNNKIYLSQLNLDKLSVIENPDQLGSAANFIIDGVDLNGKFAANGLPAFNQSYFFSPSILVNNTCQGEAVSFNFSTNQTILNATWNFGDGTTSNAIQPNHVYTSANDYTVSVTITTPNGSGTSSQNITILPQPSLNVAAVTLKQCDDNIDGFSNFNLNETIPLLVSNPVGLTITFHESQADADDNDNAIANFTAYTNQIVSNDAIFVRVENSNGCYKTAQINLVVSTTLIPQSFQIVKTECDDLISGSNTDGIATFDFSDATLQIQNLYPTGQLLTISYYKNITDALAETNAITNTTNFTNTTSPNLQDIYVRVDSQLNNDCLGLGKHIKLVVERIPIIQPQVIKHCDDNQDGIYTFDTTNLQTNLLNGLTNVIVTYTSQNGTVLQSPFPNSFSTASQFINVNIKNNYGKQCSYATTIQFTVDDLPEIFGINTLTTSACDDEPFPNQQNGSYPFNTVNFQTTLLGNQTGMIVKYYDANNNPLPSPLSNPFNTATQNVTVEILNPLNTTCKATAILPFVVNPVPKIELFGNELVCSNNPTFTKIINAGVLDVTTIADFTYQWFLNGVLIPNETNYDLTVNTEGIYTVTVTNNLNCSRTRTLTVTASNTATVNTIEVSDLSNENSIVVLVSGQGDYQYSLDDETYQNSNEFYNLIPGVYTVYIRDKNGCGTVQEEVSILGIPKYFTPNGDGFNDFWNIKGVTLSNNNEALIYIFDRFGKLLKQISPIGQGWDGSYNGEMLPSEDYWYTVKLEDNRIFKGHFCLKR